jgi:glycerol-3-phosphate acyltransferase PlsY
MRTTLYRRAMRRTRRWIAFFFLASILTTGALAVTTLVASASGKALVFAVFAVISVFSVWLEFGDGAAAAVVMGTTSAIAARRINRARVRPTS